MKNMTKMTVVMLAVMLFLTACGGVKVAEPTGKYTDKNTGEIITDSVDLLEKAKNDNPEEYKLFYELSKNTPELTKQFIKLKEKEFSEKKEIEIVSDTEGKITEKEFVDILSGKHNIKSNPTATIEAYYSALAEREFEAAFELISRDGFAFSRYGTPNTFRIMNSNLDTEIKVTGTKIEQIKLLDLGDEPVVKIGYKIQGFFVVLPDTDGEEPPKELEPFEPKNEEEAKKMMEQGQQQVAEAEWEYKETGIGWITLVIKDGKWLINDLP